MPLTICGALLLAYVATLGGRKTAMQHVSALILFEAVDSGSQLNSKHAKHLRKCAECRRLLWCYSHLQVQKLQRRARKVYPFRVAA